MKQALHEPSAVADLIRSGRRLLLAADQKLLTSLPQGSWLGGTIPYFIGDQGGVRTRELIHVTELPPYVDNTQLRYYEGKALSSVYEDAKPYGFSFIMIPGMSKTHTSFALEAPRYSSFAGRPLIGWITGVDVNDIGKGRPAVVDGRTGKAYEDGAVVMHAALPRGKVAEIDIFNMFRQGTGPAMEFLEDGFSAREVVIGGQRTGLADYVKRHSVDTHLPLVADYAGAMINTSFQSIEEKTGVVSFYAPVFKGMQYRLAADPGDYVENFTSKMPHATGNEVAFSCNCILNYLYAGLEGRRTGAITGPVTFGEIAYQLLNQTLVYLTISDTR